MKKMERVREKMRKRRERDEKEGEVLMEGS